jgi:hypothetical protein
MDGCPLPSLKVVVAWRISSYRRSNIDVFSQRNGVKRNATHLTRSTN